MWCCATLASGSAGTHFLKFDHRKRLQQATRYDRLELVHRKQRWHMLATSCCCTVHTLLAVLAILQSKAAYLMTKSSRKSNQGNRKLPPARWILAHDQSMNVSCRKKPSTSSHTSLDMNEGS